MAFENGTSGNPHGRQKGSVNRATAAVKERVEAVLAELDTTILTDVGWLNATERIALWLKLQEFVRPKLQRMALPAEEDAKRPDRLTVHVVSGYHDANGNFVTPPPLRHNERDVDDE